MARAPGLTDLYSFAQNINLSDLPESHKTGHQREAGKGKTLKENEIKDDWVIKFSPTRGRDCNFQKTPSKPCQGF